MGAQEKTVKIIGAGVAGLTVAAELADRGYSVSVHEMGTSIGAKSCSWYAGGMLAPWCEVESAEEAVATLGSEAADWWDRQTGLVERNGSLVVAQPRDASDLMRFSRRTDHFEWVDGNAIAELEPSLEGRFRKGLCFKSEGHLNPRDALTTLATRLKAKGVTIHLESDGLTAPKADITINATGIAARSSVPDLRGVKGEMLIIKTDEVQLSRPVRMIHPRIPLYVVPRVDGHFMVGATMIESGERGRITARSMIELLSAAYALHPAFGEAEIVEIGTDVRPAYPDNLPRITFEDGIYYVNGLYRHGFLLSPALARMTAELIAGEGTPSLFHSPEYGDQVHESDRQRASA